MNLPEITMLEGHQHGLRDFRFARLAQQVDDVIRGKSGQMQLFNLLRLIDPVEGQ